MNAPTVLFTGFLAGDRRYLEALAEREGVCVIHAHQLTPAIDYLVVGDQPVPAGLQVTVEGVRVMSRAEFCDFINGLPAV
jgi:NAD-dependent DNA ligase